MSEQTGTKKRRLNKGKLGRFIFCVLSLIFFLFCCIFYGIRLVKYYKIYNPKSESGEKMELLATHITKNNSVVFEGDGLYRTNGIYMFKGEKVNNYLYFSHMLWRIVKVNGDNSVDIVSAYPINNLMWNRVKTNYIASDVHKYLNDVFLKTLSKDKLKKTSICTDVVTDITKATCEKVNEDYYVKLLSATDFLNSKNKTSTFINDTGSLWLSDVGKNNVWYAKGTSLSSYDPSESYPIKPVVTLKMDNTVLDGKGTLKEPYQIEKETKEIKAGSYVKLGDDLWVAYDVGKEKTKLIAASILDTKYRFDTASNLYNPQRNSSLAKYLNTTYYNKLSYQKTLVKDTWYIGSYTNSYKDIYKKEIESYVGLYNIADLKYIMTDVSYYLLTPDKAGTVYTYGPYLTPSRVSLAKGVRPAIAIATQKAKSGKGTAESPYEVEG